MVCCPSDFYGRSETMQKNKPSPRLCKLEMQVRKTIQDHSMINSGEHILVAVSGGADSTALLLCLHRLSSEFQLILSVAHLNHRIRGLEGDEDQDFVRQMSSELQLPFVSEIIEVRRQAAATKCNLEEYARQKRYTFLRHTALQVGAQKIAVGHNLNDQAETALFRFVRGSGIEGLSAIYPVVDGLVIRPLLECSRNSIREYLKQEGMNYREDSSNQNLRHARNRIRQELVPYLEKHFNPNLIPIVARETSLMRETWSRIVSLAAKTYQGLHSRTETGISLNLTSLLDLHPALQKQVLRQALKACMGSLRGINSIHMQSLLMLSRDSHSGDQIQLPHGSVVIRQFDKLLFLKHAPLSAPAFAYPLNTSGGHCNVAEANVMLHCMICSAPDSETMKQKCATQAFLELSTLPQSLMVRSRIPGDRYGGPGHRKVKKMLIDRKIPLPQRSVLPIVADGNNVIWIPGFEPAHAYAALPLSQKCLRVEMILDSQLISSDS
jgi:tRNA(Ile)-lysidine synthase